MAKTSLMVVTLIDIFHRMENGGISVPNFTRGFVWPRPMVKKLLESIYLGYPIGTISAVKGPPDLFKWAASEYSHFPHADSDSYNAESTLWIIDGLQRLVALYGALKGGSPMTDIYFDLVKKDFLHKPRPSEKNPTVKMSSLFDYAELMACQERLFFKDESNSLLDVLNQLHQKFQDYQIPLQIIDEVDQQQIAEVFTRLNISGRPLSKDDLQRAKSQQPNNE